VRILRWWVEIVVAAVLIYLHAWASLAVFTYLVAANFQVHRTMNYLRAILRVFQHANDVRLLALMEKLGVSEGDVERASDLIRTKMGEDVWRTLEDDNSTAKNG